MTSATETAPIESFANLTLNDNGFNGEDDAPEEESGDSEFDGYATTDPQVSLLARVVCRRIETETHESFTQSCSKQFNPQIEVFDSKQRLRSGAC